MCVWIAIKSLSNGKTYIPMHQTEKQVFCLNELKASYVELNFYPNTPTRTSRSEPEVPSQLKWKGLPQLKKRLPNTQLQPFPGQPIIQLLARAITMHETPRKKSSLLFPWRIPSCGPHYWKIIWWWPYPGRSSSHHTPSGTT